MIEHLPESTVNALADGHLAGEEMAAATAHLARCAECTSDALAKMMLKQTVALAGRRYALPDSLRAKLSRAYETQPTTRRRDWSRWAAAAMLFLAIAGSGWWQLAPQHGYVVSDTGTATEITDQHVAATTASAGLEVLSSDRHTVKPWFQGKMPFSFNVPEALPDGTTLEGANLTYIGHRPAAQLLFSVGKHRASVFIMEKSQGRTSDAASRVSGFNMVERVAHGLEIVAVSDVEMARLQELTHAIEQVQR